MTERFRIDIVRKNFISFNPRRVPDDDKDRFNPRIIWPFVHDNVLVDREIDDLRGNGFEFHFPGRIKIVLRESEIPGFVVGRGFDTMGADAAHGGYQIPSAKITTNTRANKSSIQPQKRELYKTVCNSL